MDQDSRKDTDRGTRTKKLVPLTKSGKKKLAKRLAVEKRLMNRRQSYGNQNLMAILNTGSAVKKSIKLSITGLIRLMENQTIVTDAPEKDSRVDRFIGQTYRVPTNLNGRIGGDFAPNAMLTLINPQRV